MSVDKRRANPLKVPQKWLLYFKRGLSRGQWDKQLDFEYRPDKAWIKSNLHEEKRKTPGRMYKEGYSLGYNYPIPNKASEQRQWLEEHHFIKVVE